MQAMRNIEFALCDHALDYAWGKLWLKKLAVFYFSCNCSLYVELLHTLSSGNAIKYLKRNT